MNLAEQHGKEGFITNAYRDYVGELGNKDLLYVFSCILGCLLTVSKVLRV